MELLKRDLLIAKNGGIDPDNTNNTLFQQILKHNNINDYGQNKTASVNSTSTHQLLQNQSQHNVSSVSQDVKASLCNEIEALNKELLSVQKTCMLSKDKIQQF